MGCMGYLAVVFEHEAVLGDGLCCEQPVTFLPRIADLHSEGQVGAGLRSAGP
jgi:hypothetical protein